MDAGNPVPTTPLHVEHESAPLPPFHGNDRSGDPVPTEPPQGALALYERARQALSEAVRVDEVQAVRNTAERMKLYARQARDRAMLADAMELQVRAERRLGELLKEAKETGQLSRGGRPRSSARAEQEGGPAPETDSSEEPVSLVTLAEAGINGKLSMKAQKLAEVPEAAFEASLRRSRDKIAAGGAVVVNPIKDLTTAEKQVKRMIRERQLAARQKALPDRRYGVILEDPEWRYETWSEAGKDRAADNHYPTSTTAVIASRPVAALAAEDAVYFLWATVPMLPDALQVMAARGFAYKTHFVWDKLEEGTGYWNRNRHELLLVGTRGSVPAPAAGTQYPSLVAERKTAHSTKPAWAYELIEAYYPSLPRIELNARTRRDGWDAWGFEAPEDDEIGQGAPRPLSVGEGAPSGLEPGDLSPHHPIGKAA